MSHTRRRPRGGDEYGTVGALWLEVEPHRVGAGWVMERRRGMGESYACSECDLEVIMVLYDKC